MLSVSLVKNRFQERTTLEKCLLGVLFLLTAVLVGLIIALSLKTKKENGSVCTSAACHAVGSTIRNSLDLSVNPCEDFYSYCCGRWLKTQEFPKDRRKYGVMEKLQTDVFEKLNDLLASSNFSGSAIRSTVTFYNSCINTSAIETRGAEPLLNFVSQFGGWPGINDTWQKRNFDYLSALATIQRKTSYGFIIPLIISTDPKNTSRKILQIDQHSLLISEEILQQRNLESSKKDLENFKNFYLKVVKIMGAKEMNLTDDFNGIIDLETKLLEMMSSKENMNNIDYWYNLMSIEELQKKIPQVDWLRYLQLITNSSLLRINKAPVIQTNDLIIVRDLPYLQKVTVYLRNKANYRQIANYLGWRVTINLMQHLPQSFANALEDYIAKSGYPRETPERWKICIDEVNSNFPEVAAFLYVQKYFPADVRNEVMKLILDVSFQFEKLLLNNDWMDLKTKNAALKKLRAIKVNVGYPDYINDENNLEDFYDKASFPTMTEQIFENDLKLSEHRTMEVIKSLKIKAETEEWPMSPITINAAYNRNLNSITFPAAFLQLPLYDGSLPYYFNYAAIGSIIGHEITHGFDNEGSKRNAAGEIYNWWSNESKRTFDKKTTCFINQYDKYGLNGIQTLAENIADSGGLRQAYASFLSWKEKQTSTTKLPGLEDFNIDQLFFLSYGSIWCTKYGDGILNYTIKEAEHAPSSYRLIGSVDNLEEFSNVFQCEKDSPQGKENRCVVW